MTSDPFHEEVRFEIKLLEAHTAGQINRILKEYGATLHYDVYSFEREEQGPIWQSESYAWVTTYHDNIEVDAQSSIDKLELAYPLATIGTEYITKFAILVTALADKFSTDVTLEGVAKSKDDIIAHCETLVTDLMENFGEEPGSEVLAMMIESNYP